MNETILILLAGGHASGKRSGCKILQQQLQKLDGELNVKEIDMNDYLEKDKLKPGCKEPKLYKWDILKDQLNFFMSQDYDVIILYGLYALYNNQIMDQATVKVFIDCDADIRLGRWIERDILSRSRDSTLNAVSVQHQQNKELENLLDIYLRYSRTEMKIYINDTKENADIILPRGADLVGFSLILDGLKPLLLKKFYQHQKKSNSEVDDAYAMKSTSSISSMSRDTVLHTLKQISEEPSVQSLTNDNFFNTTKIFHEAN